MTKIRGFTFIELLIAVSIFAVISITLYSTFFAGVSVWKRSGAGGSVYQNMKFVLDDITGDLKNAVYLSEDEESIFAFSGANKEIEFITLEPAFSEEGMTRELVKVNYSFNGEAGQIIMSRAGMSKGFNAENAEKEILLEGLEDLMFEYCYDSEDDDDPYLWHEEWEDEKMRLPRGVKVTLLLEAEAAGEKALKLTSIIFVPTGVLGEEEIGL